MSFQPVVPFGGFLGWAVLQRTRDLQEQAFQASPAIERDVDYFREHIADVKTASDLMSDRRLLTVALGAFGLDEDINNKAFIEQVLDDGFLSDTALANRLADKRHLALSKAFGFGDFSIANTQLLDFPQEIIDAFHEQQFEIAIGRSDENLRLALGLERDLGEIIATDTTDDGRWFAVMGQAPLRKVFEVALGLPTTFGALDLDQQLAGFRDKAERVFGDSEIAHFADTEVQDELRRLFLLRAQVADLSSLSAQSSALLLLQSSPVSYSLT